MFKGTAQGLTRIFYFIYLKIFFDNDNNINKRLNSGFNSHIALVMSRYCPGWEKRFANDFDTQPVQRNNAF